MTDIIGTDGKEIKSEAEQKRDSVIALIKQIGLEAESKDKKTEGALILLKVDGKYLRYSTGIDNALDEVAQLELLKHDILRRMLGG